MLQCTEVSDEMVLSLIAGTKQAQGENVLVLEKKPPHRQRGNGKNKAEKNDGWKKIIGQQEIQNRNKPPLSTASSEG